MLFGLDDSCFAAAFFSTANGSIARGSAAVLTVGDGARGAAVVVDEGLVAVGVAGGAAEEGLD